MCIIILITRENQGPRLWDLSYINKRMDSNGKEKSLLRTRCKSQQHLVKNGGEMGEKRNPCHLGGHGGQTLAGRQPHGREALEKELGSLFAGEPQSVKGSLPR